MPAERRTAPAATVARIREWLGADVEIEQMSDAVFVRYPELRGVWCYEPRALFSEPRYKLWPGLHVDFVPEVRELVL